MKSLSSEQKSYLFRSIRTVRDFPKPGILFYDITTLVGDREAFNFLLDHLAERYADYGLDYIVGIESRGFIFAAALAARLRVAFVPIRKPKKLPYITITPIFSVCHKHGYISGEHEYCPKCDEELLAEYKAKQSKGA